MHRIVFTLLFVAVVGCTESTKTTSAPPKTEPAATMNKPDASKSAEPKSPEEEWISPDAKGPGIHQLTHKLSTGTELRYTIDIPEGYDGRQRVPLIFALHYGGKVTPWYGRGVIEILVRPALDELRGIIVAPDSIAGPWTNETNEQAVFELMSHIKQTYNIEGRQVILTGFSMGGAGTWYVGGRSQDLFCAIVPVAGRPQTGIKEWIIPAYVIHSKADTVVPYAPAEAYTTKMKDAGYDFTLHSVEDTTHFNTAAFAEPLREAVPWLRKKMEAAMNE